MRDTTIDITKNRLRNIKKANPIMTFFTSKHLPEQLHEISKLLDLLAQEMDSRLPDSAEKNAGLRKLLEAKNCFCRASL